MLALARGRWPLDAVRGIDAMRSRFSERSITLRNGSRAFRTDTPDIDDEPVPAARETVASAELSHGLSQVPAEKPKAPSSRGLQKYRYRDSNPGFRRERAAS
jgi:hypothetical protein